MIAGLRALFVVRGAQVDLIVQQQPAQCPRAVGGAVFEAAEGIAELRLAEAGFHRLQQVERAAAKGKQPFQRPALAGADARHSGGDQAGGHAVLVTRIACGRRDVDDAARARAVAHRESAAEHFDALDAGRIDGADQALVVLEMERIQQRDAVVAHQHVVFERSADVGAAGGVARQAWQGLQRTQGIVVTSRHHVDVARGKLARLGDQAAFDRIATGVDRDFLQRRFGNRGGRRRGRYAHHHVFPRRQRFEPEAMRRERVRRQFERRAAARAAAVPAGPRAPGRSCR